MNSAPSVPGLGSSVVGSPFNAPNATTNSLTSNPLLVLLSDPAQGGRAEVFPAGAIVHEQDTVADTLYVVQRGQVRVHRMGPESQTLLLDIHGPGAWFGAASLTASATHHSRATAVVPSTVLKVSTAAVSRALLQQPALALEMVRQLASREQAARDDHARLVFDDCNARLITTLIRFSTTAAAQPFEGGEGNQGIVLRITHQQLAQAVGVARETVSLALTQLRRQNLLRTGRNQLFFDPEALRQFAQRGGLTRPAPERDTNEDAYENSHARPTGNRPPDEDSPTSQVA